MNIRKMLIGDYEKIYHLWLSCKGMGLNDVDDSKSGITRFLERNPDTCFVAEKDGELVGTIMAGDDGRRGYLYHTAVHPSYRKQGIASALVKTALEALNQRGVSKAVLVAFEKNRDGNVFWEKQGFAARDDLVYRNKTLVEMTRMET